jgi:hypothetical protein
MTNGVVQKGHGTKLAVRFQDGQQTISVPDNVQVVGVVPGEVQLVYRLAINDDVAGGQLAVFQGASEAPISESYGSSEQRGKTANWPRPGGLR